MPKPSLPAATAAVLATCAATQSVAHAQWIPNYQVYTIRRIGLFGPEHTGSGGLQFSQAGSLSVTSSVAGTSRRITGVSTSNGENTWVYNPATGTTVQTGLTGAAWTGSAGHQFGANSFQNSAGQVVGFSDRYTIGGSGNGRDTWVYNSSAGMTVQTNLTGTAWTGSGGFQFGINNSQNSAGQVAGSSWRVTGVDTNNGLNTWVYNPATGTTVQTGLTGAVWTGSGGFQQSATNLQNDAGHLAGSSLRIAGVFGSNGSDTWAYSPTLNATVQTGLIGTVWTGPLGYQFSEHGGHMNRAGDVTGISHRIAEISRLNGLNTWVYRPSTGTTTQTGLIGPTWTGSAGFQFSRSDLLNDAGHVAGISRRIIGTNTNNGDNTWFFDPATNTTVQTGLFGPEHTDAIGYQFSDNQFQNAAGQTAGRSRRFTSGGLSNGDDTWVYNPTTRSTVQIGLTSASNTGSEGYRLSRISFQNATGELVGFSFRISGVSSVNGRDAWYYDPITGLSSAVVGSVRITDNYAESIPTLLTEDGFLLGNYLFFPGGLGSGEQRAFVFRPDLGLTDLGTLVDGGLTASGWSTLQSPVFSNALRTIVGHGFVNGQTSGQSVFIMVPAPGAAALLATSGLLAMRRRRN